MAETRVSGVQMGKLLLFENQSEPIITVRKSRGSVLNGRLDCAIKKENSNAPLFDALRDQHEIWD
jgi:hypothetical protein